MSLWVRSIAFVLRAFDATEYCWDSTRPMISQSLTYCKKNWTCVGSGRYSVDGSPSSSMKSSSETISTSESSVLIETGRPRATATERSLVNKVHHTLFQSRLSGRLSCELSTLFCVSGSLPWSCSEPTSYAFRSPGQQ
jgi:hypothetical protein